MKKKDSQSFFSSSDQEDVAVNIKELIVKYLVYWPWFLFSSLIFTFLAFAYVYVTPNMYETEAKIKIIDENKQMEMTLDLESLMKGSSINLDNEIAVLTSYRLLAQVVEELGLDVSVYMNEGFRKQQMWKTPFFVEKVIEDDKIIEPLVYEITFYENNMYVESVDIKGVSVEYNEQGKLGLPFVVSILDKNEMNTIWGESFEISIRSKKEAVLSLQKNLKVSPTTGESEILSLVLQGQRAKRTETILNTVIDKFDQDGILDRQLVNKRTIDFIDTRFEFLIEELDSIEGDKESFQKKNNLSYIGVDAQVTIEQRELAKKELFDLNNQIDIVEMLDSALKEEPQFSLLPSNIGISNESINSLVNQYNEVVLERSKSIETGAGEKNPLVKVLNSEINNTRQNILSSISVYRKQLKKQLDKVKSLKNQTSGAFGQLPKKIRMLREIERQQNLKESLYLLLLQKREEAAISYAVTAPSIKIVDYGITNDKPVAPKRKILLLGAFVFGLGLTFLVLYLMFLLDNKIHGKVDLEKELPEVPVLAELPFVEGQEILNAGDSRSSLAEAFRILSTNVEYLLPKEEEGNGRVVFVTSTKKGEGKTFVALNLSLALASLNKKVLLVGSDLRNPQLHKYFEKDKNFSKGLSGYLFDTEMQFKDCWEEGFTDFPTHKICFSGVIPPNAPQLLASKRYGQFMEEACKEFDYVIVDTAPTILVTDTLMISKYADETVYVTRADYTEKEILNFAKELHDHEKLNNMAFVVNAVGKSAKGYGYKYGYGYSYGYGYGYGYNYGYGYGYGSDEDTSAKKKKKGLFKRFRK